MKDRFSRQSLKIKQKSKAYSEKRTIKEVDATFIWPPNDMLMKKLVHQSKGSTTKLLKLMIGQIVFYIKLIFKDLTK